MGAAGIECVHHARRDGPPLRVFGRLAAGVELSTAQAELTSMALRNATEFPETDRHIRPIVKPYVQSLWSAVEDSKIQTVVFYSANVLFLGLLVLCGANVATLVFARTVSRDAEISIRTALGASRARIAGQFFAEALVVARRTPEIGIRLALGASPGRIVLSTFSRALAQVGLGLAIGSIPAWRLLINLAPEVAPIATHHTATVACLAATCVVAAVTTLACVMPAPGAAGAAEGCAQVN